MVRLSRKRFIKTAAGLVLPAWACSGQVVIPGAIMRPIAAGGSQTLFTDDFSGTLAAWTLEAGGFDITGGEMRATTGGFADNLNIYSTAMNTTSGHVRYTRREDSAFPRIAFRFTNDASPYYAIEISNSLQGWYRYASVGGASAQIGTDFSASTAIGTVIGITWTGTGTGTIIRMWIDTASTQHPGASATWNGVAPDHTWSDDPASPVDSGALCGLGGGQGSANLLLYDNFSGGDNV